ncbi:MAG TPA: hypothetical protein VFQ88_12880, partial [Nevskiaceae bacterium]|nr:hypothetical protein [Nevskiaceae bacterium]
MVRKRYGYVHGPIIRLKIVWATLTKLWIQWSGLQVDQPASVDYWKSPDEGDPDGAQDYPAGDYADTVDDLQSNIVYTLAMRPKVFEHNTSNGAIMRTA